MLTSALKLLTRPKDWPRAAFLGVFGVGAVLALILFAYELALARIPQHRAALERIVRGQTGLDIRFGELGLRWGWYGPEAVFRQVELDEPGSAHALLRAPELVVGFDVWRTLRSGHPEAGRIELVAPEIDLSSARERHGVGADPAVVTLGHVGAAVGESSVLGRVAVLQGWRGGRIDIEGGTLRLPEHRGNANLLNVQIHRATLRRSDDEWSVTGLVYLPDRVGRSAQVTLRLAGDLSEPAGLAGTLHVDARRLLFPGCRDFLAGLPELAGFLPRGGNADASFDLSFAQGRIVSAKGNTRASGLVFDALPGAQSVLALGRLHGDWRATRVGPDWRIQLDSLDLMKGEPLATLTIDTGEGAARPAQGRWLHGTLEQVPLPSLLAVARWLAPHFDLAGVQLEGTARQLAFDWAAGRAAGERLRTYGRLENIALLPQSRDFTLSGLNAQLTGNESQLRLEVRATTARLELAQSQQPALSDVHVTSTLQVSSGPGGWQIATDAFVLEHQRASLRLSGQLQDDPLEPRIVATGTLTGADIPLVARLLGQSTATAFGAAASQLTAGRIQNAEFAMRGPINKLPFEAGGDGFTGSLTLHDARLSGGDLWPDLESVDARLDWRGARIQASIDSARAGPFQLVSAKAQWSAAGGGATRLIGHVNGRLEDALTWVRDHPQLQQYAPAVGDIDARGEAGFDFNVLVPAGVAAEAAPSPVAARVATFVDRATVQIAPGLSPLQEVTGSFTFDSGRLQKSVLTGSWLGGPVMLRVSERREKGARVLTVKAQGTLQAQQVVALANVTGSVEGDADWSAEVAYLPGDGSAPHWRLRADSSLSGVASSLPEPFAKRSGIVTPVRLEATGTADGAQTRAKLWVLGRHAPEVSLRAQRTTDGTDVLIDSAMLAGVARWPAAPTAEQPAELHLTRLDLPGDTLPPVGVELIAALGPAARVSVDELSWRERSLGRLTANVTAEGKVLVVDSLRLINGTQAAHGALRCQTALPSCRLSFVVDSTDAAATLTDFGFRPDVAAKGASLKGDMEWQPSADDRGLRTAQGTLSMQLADGALRGGESESDGAQAALSPFGLLAVPALVSALNTQASEFRGLHFDRLEADFDVRDGQANTSNLHFDGDAEILMRGRTGLLARDYDQQVWVLRGEERLPAAVRRFGATPRVAAAWLSLRDLFTGGGSQDRSRAVLRLQGSWDDPMVMAEN